MIYISIGIYRIYNKINNKSYIGQSVNVENRRKSHLNSLEYDSSKHFSIHRALIKYGVENFEFEVLEECTVKELDEKEIYWIEKYNSFYKGYNETLGGQNVTYQKLSYEKVIEIRELLLTKISMEEIASIYNVLPCTISMINTGKMHKDDEIDYPIRQKPKTNLVTVNLIIEELFKNDLTISEISQKFGVSKYVAYDINTGKSFFDSNLDYPIRKKDVCRHAREKPDKETLLNEILEVGFKQTSVKYNKTSSTIRNWAKSYGLPTNMKDIRNIKKGVKS